MADEKKKTALEDHIENLEKQLSRKYQQMKLVENEVDLQKLINEIEKDQEEIIKQQVKAIEQKHSLYGQITTKLKSQARELAGLNRGAITLSSSISAIYTTLMSVDKSIRQTNLNLGFTGGRAEMVRNNFESTAGYVARLGGSFEDLQTITTRFADETGRARALSEDTLKNIIDMGKGTALGVEGAAQLVSHYHLIGVDAQRAAEHTLGVVETSERMGVSASKVLNEINKNFSRLRTFTFVQGVKGFEQMATYAEKMRISMDQALDSAEAARRLDNAIEMAAQLQVMGGEFAKTDPFELLFLARNDPAQYTKKINEMTKGVISFRKMADGTYEHFLSPADRDRLTRAAEVLGLQSDELIEQSRRMAEMQKIRQQLSGQGLSLEDKELIEGISRFESSIGKFVVDIGGKAHVIENLTSAQLKSFSLQAKTLEERAMDAQTFDEAFQATINELKTTMLPLLAGINDILQIVRPIAVWVGDLLSSLPESMKKTMAYIGAGLTLIRGATLLYQVTGLKWMKNAIMARTKMSSVVATFQAQAEQEARLRLQTAAREVSIRIKGAKKEMAIRSGGLRSASLAGPMPRGGAVTGMPRMGGVAPPPPAPPVRTAPAAPRGGAAGMGMLRGGAGIGAAGVGIGAGIGIAALGISELAKSLKELDERQVKTLERIGLALAIGFPLAAIGLMVLGTAAAFSWKPLLGVGAAIALLGAGVALAGLGIKFMADGFVTLYESISLINIGDTLKMAASFYILSPALMTLGAALLFVIPGMLVFSGTAVALGLASKLISGSFATIGDSFEKIGTGMGTFTQSFKELRARDLIRSIVPLRLLSTAMREFGSEGVADILKYNEALTSITKKVDDLEKIGGAFKNINTVLSGSMDDFDKVEKIIKSLANVDVKEKSMFSEMVKLFNKPLKVEFADKEANFVSNVTLKLDGQTIAEKISVFIPNKLEKNRLGFA